MRHKTAHERWQAERDADCSTLCSFAKSMDRKLRGTGEILWLKVVGRLAGHHQPDATDARHTAVVRTVQH